jgi:hypothetical protein
MRKKASFDISIMNNFTVSKKIMNNFTNKNIVNLKYFVDLYIDNIPFKLLREFNSIDSDIVLCICRGLKFEPRSSHLSTLKVKFLATKLLDKEKNIPSN